jgi:hypothetical protein
MVKRASNQAGSESGFVLVICLILLLMLSLIGIASITTSTSDMRVSGNELNQTGAFYAAESGLERAAASIISSYQSTGHAPDPLPHGSLTENGYQYDYTTTDNGAATQQTLDEGAYRGLYGLVKSFTINSTGNDLDGESRVRLSMNIQDALIPLYQFAVFYQNDLELSPIGAMTLNGRVHSNGDIYVQSNSGISLISYLTAAGNIYHGPKPGSGLAVANGDVLIQDKLDTYQNMRNPDNSWLDSRASDWVSSSIARWGGMLEDDNHGITELNMPVVTSGPTTNLIDRSAGNPDSYENKAGLKLVDGQVYFLQNDGNWANRTSDFINAPPLGYGIISNPTFFDSREGVYVSSTDIDMGKLAASPYFPSNGVIYCSTPTMPGSLRAFRLTDAATIPAKMTLATNNPLYTMGNFNINTKKSVALLADAITVLSGSWLDANSDRNLNQRVATPTQVNASFMTGSTETNLSNGYNGGYENLLRLLEKWDGSTFTWRGAATCMWLSRQAVGPWSSGNFYSSPTRDWAFDTDLLDVTNLPPGTPMIHIVQRSQWVQHFD